MKFLPNTPWSAVVASIVILTAACQKIANNQTASEEQPAPAATPPPMAKLITPAPKAVVAKTAPAQPTPVQNFTAPEGVYFLTTAVSVETAEGVAGLRPGTRAVKQADGRYLADGHLVTLRPEQLTNDTRFATRAVQADRAAQAAIERRLAPPPLEKKSASAKAAKSLNERRDPDSATGDGRKYIPGVTTRPSGLQTSTARGSRHTRTANGWLWQKTPDGKSWTAVKQLDKRATVAPPDVP